LTPAFPTRFGPCDPAAKPGFLSWGCPKIAPPSYTVEESDSRPLRVSPSLRVAASRRLCASLCVSSVLPGSPSLRVAALLREFRVAPWLPLRSAVRSATFPQRFHCVSAAVLPALLRGSQVPSSASPPRRLSTLLRCLSAGWLCRYNLRDGNANSHPRAAHVVFHHLDGLLLLDLATVLQAAADPGVHYVSFCRETEFPAVRLLPFEAFPPPTATATGTNPGLRGPASPLEPLPTLTFTANLALSPFLFRGSPQQETCYFVPAKAEASGPCSIVGSVAPSTVSSRLRSVLPWACPTSLRRSLRYYSSLRGRES